MEKEKTVDAKLCIILLQAVAVIIIIVTVLIIKYLDGNLFTKLKEWYIDNFEQSTQVSEVLEDGDTESDNIVLPDEDENTQDDERVVLTNAVNIDKIKYNAPLNIKKYNTMVLPVEGLVTSSFGDREDPFSGNEAIHKGVDIAANSGTDIKCAAEGTVLSVGYDEFGYGNYIIIQHSQSVETLYAHCSRIIAKKGQKVKAGEVLAKVGNTGRSTGSHLHFEISVNGLQIDPEIFLGEI